MLILHALVGLAVGYAQTGDEVTLRRVFAANDVQRFVMTNVLTGEEQSGTLLTWQPFRLTVTDKYSFKVLSLAPAGTADVRYDSEGVTYHHGQEVGRDPRDDKQDPSWVILTMSPTNETLVTHDFSRPKKKDKKPADSDGLILPLMSAPGPQPQITANVIGAVVQTFLSLRLLEFGPVLPWHPVKVGDTWEDTLSSLPGQTPNRDPSKRAPRNQRLDITYRFDGLKPRNGAQVWAIHGSYSADLDLKRNLLEGQPKQVLEMQPITSATAKVKGEMDFFLDPKNGNVLFVQSSATGEVSVETPERFIMLRHQVKLKSDATVQPVKK